MLSRSGATHVIALLLAGCASNARPASSEHHAVEVAEPAPLLESLISDEPDDIVTLPGESGPVERVLFGWHAGNWGYLRYFGSVMRAVVSDARLLIAVESLSEQRALMEALTEQRVDLSRVDFVIHPLDSMWIRDYGPVLVRTREGGYRVMDLPYHADRVGDDAYPARFAAHEGLPISRPPIAMEGGHLQSDGTGRCVVSDDVMRRDPASAPSEEGVRRVLRAYFGCASVTIVPRLYAEETGHVDVFAYITGPGRVLVGTYRREDDLVNSRRLDRSAALLEEAGFEVTRVPMPGNSRRRVFRTYTNVLVLDRSVLVPVFRNDREHEQRALRAIAASFPGRRLVPIRADGVMGLAGALHCTAIAIPPLQPRYARVPRRPARRRG